MHTATFILGGCRSGKSRHALFLGDSTDLQRKLFIATCVPQDDEMRARVRRHQHERGSDWQTLEVPVELADAIAQSKTGTDLVLIDCLTLWISNIMLADEEEAQRHRRIDRLCDILKSPPCRIIIVSNEVGTGIVPENALARHYRDLVGRANQQVAAICRQVIWMVAGIPVSIKP